MDGRTALKSNPANKVVPARKRRKTASRRFTRPRITKSRTGGEAAVTQEKPTPKEATHAHGIDAEDISRISRIEDQGEEADINEGVKAKAKGDLYLLNL